MSKKPPRRRRIRRAVQALVDVSPNYATKQDLQELGYKVDAISEQLRGRRGRSFLVNIDDQVALRFGSAADLKDYANQLARCGVPFEPAVGNVLVVERSAFDQLKLPGRYEEIRIRYPSDLTLAEQANLPRYRLTVKESERRMTEQIRRWSKRPHAKIESKARKSEESKRKRDS